MRDSRLVRWRSRQPVLSGVLVACMQVKAGWLTQKVISSSVTWLKAEEARLRKSQEQEIPRGLGSKVRCLMLAQTMVAKAWGPNPQEGLWQKLSDNYITKRNDPQPPLPSWIACRRGQVPGESIWLAEFKSHGSIGAGLKGGKQKDVVPLSFMVGSAFQNSPS